MKLIVIYFFLLSLVACSASNSNNTGSYKMPPEMTGCKVFRLAGEGLNKTLYVVKCPNSVTTTNWEEPNGKNSNMTYSVTVQSGKE